MIAACAAAAGGHTVRLLEKNEKLGKKIYITGKGRCNFTNACDFNTFMGNVVSNPKFMFSSLRSFDQQAVTDFLEANGCRTKVERGMRAFPLSDHASDVTKALERFLRSNNVKVDLCTEVIEVRSIRKTKNEAIEASKSADTESPEKIITNEDTDTAFSVIARKQGGKRAVLYADSVVVATGGLSYPSTGSTGDGYIIAKDHGLSVEELSPALVPLETADDFGEHRSLQGVSLKNVSVIVFEKGKKKPIYESETGELLFTHFGLSGPLILSTSSLISKGLRDGKKYKLEIDLKPALGEKALDERILRDFENAMNMNIENALSKLLISSLRPVILRRVCIPETKKVRDISRNERSSLIHEIKHMSFDITGTRGFNEAIITQGGVKTSELDPKTLEAKKCRGLYFAGEVIDVDAFTGGFNLQIAWSTGYAAGSNIR